MKEYKTLLDALRENGTQYPYSVRLDDARYRFHPVKWWRWMGMYVHES